MIFVYNWCLSNVVTVTLLTLEDPQTSLWTDVTGVTTCPPAEMPPTVPISKKENAYKVVLGTIRLRCFLETS